MALRLFIEGLDAVSVHTLAAAGGELAEQLVRDVLSDTVGKRAAGPNRPQPHNHCGQSAVFDRASVALSPC